MSDQKPPQLAHRDNVTQVQVANILSIFNYTANFLIASRMHVPEDGYGNKVGGPTDGGAEMAAEATIIKACSVLDAILADSERFSLDRQNSAEDVIKQMYSEQARMLKAQADAYSEITTPHHRYKPTIVKLKEGSWLAFAGSPTDLDNAMVGIGDSPGQAVSAFDDLFHGKVPEHLRAWLEARAVAIETGQPEPNVLDFKPKEKQNEKNNLDPGRPEHPKTSVPSPKVRHRNRRNNGPKPEVGGDGQSAE